MTPVQTATRLGLLYGAVFLIYGVQLPYLSVWLDWRGLSAAEIGMVMSLPLVLRLAVTPTVAVLADRAGTHRSAVILLAGCAAVAALVLAGVSQFAAILGVTVLFLLSLQSALPLIEALAMSNVRRLSLDYGRIRLWGSLTFIAATIGAGVILERTGPGAVPLLLLAGTALTVLAARLVPRDDGGATLSAAARPGLADTMRLVRAPAFLLFLAASGAVQAAHAVLYVFGALHWRGLGISAAWIGALWSIGVIAEIVLFARSRPLVTAFGAKGLILIGAVAAVLRWTAMGFDPPLAALVGLQALHALTYAATHLGAMHYIAQTVAPSQAGTAQAIHATATSAIGMAGATILAGQLYGPFGGSSYFAMAGLALAGVAAAARLRDPPPPRTT